MRVSHKDHTRWPGVAAGQAEPQLAHCTITATSKPDPHGSRSPGEEGAQNQGQIGTTVSSVHGCSLRLRDCGAVVWNVLGG